MKAKGVVLAAMRASEMWNVHPATDYSHECASCHERVGIFPSGKKLIKRNRRRLVIVLCNRCCDSGAWPSVPGAKLDCEQAKPK